MAVRKKYGWAITVHPDEDRYVLRNNGTLLARDLKLVADPSTFVHFEQHEGDQGPDIPPNQSKAFGASFTMMSPGNEIQIDWLPDGEKQLQQHNEVLEPIPNKVFDETVKRREAERSAEAAARERYLAESRRCSSTSPTRGPTTRPTRAHATKSVFSVGYCPTRQHGKRDRV